MRRRIALAVMVSCWAAGCGESADPRLCEQCRAIATGRDASGRAVSGAGKKAARDERDRRITLRHETARLMKELPPEFDCPGCRERYDRILRAGRSPD